MKENMLIDLKFRNTIFTKNLKSYTLSSNHDEMAEIRKMTGVCPQHDVLFDELTPREHLQYFARIRVGNAQFFGESGAFGLYFFLFISTF